MYKIFVNNINIINDCNNISWNGDSDSLGIQLSFDSIKEIPTGTVVQLFNDNNEIFRGIVIKLTQKRWTWGYTCQDYSFYLKNNKVAIKQFNGISASDAIKSLFEESYLKYEVVDIPSKISKFYTNTDRSSIIDDILKQATEDQGVEYFKEIQGNIAYVYKTTDIKIKPTIILPKEITVETSMEKMKNKITIINGSNEKAIIEATAEDTTKQDFYGILTDVQTVDDKNIAQSQNMANNALTASNKIEYQSSFDIIVLKGEDDIKPNRMIFLHAGNRLNGYYKIKTVNNSLTSSNLHKINLTIVW